MAFLGFQNNLHRYIALARLRFQPTFAEENAVNFERLRVELLQTRADLSTARINLQRAEIDVGRHGQLFLEKLVSEYEYDLVTSTRDLYKAEVLAKSNAVVEIERSMAELGSLGTLRLPATKQVLVWMSAGRRMRRSTSGLACWNGVSR